MEASLTEKLALFLVLIGSLSVHEWAHAWVADKMGDPTPRLQGRLTLNPLSHIDMLGTVIIPLTMILLAPGFAILGWGRPVIIDPRNFKRPVTGDILTSLAGPLANIILAFLTALIFGAWVGFANNGDVSQKAAGLGLNIIYLNVLLAIFNMIPVPPLDGSHIMRHLFRMSELAYLRLAQWGSLILILLINLEPFQELLNYWVAQASLPALALMEFTANLVSKIPVG